VANSLPLGVAPSFADVASRRSSANIALQFVARGLFFILFGGLSLALFFSQSAYAETIPATANTDPAPHAWYAYWNASPGFLAGSCYEAVALVLAQQGATQAMAEYDCSVLSGGGICITYPGNPRRCYGQHGQQSTYYCNGANQTSSSCTTYSCPSTGTWTLSADRQTCTGCWDSTKTPDQEGVCVGVENKELGPKLCEQPPRSSNPSDSFLE